MDISRRPFWDAACMLERADEAYSAFVRDVLEPDTSRLSADADARYELGRALTALLNRAYDAALDGTPLGTLTEALRVAARAADAARPAPVPLRPVVAASPTVVSLAN